MEPLFDRREYGVTPIDHKKRRGEAKPEHLNFENLSKYIDGLKWEIGMLYEMYRDTHSKKLMTIRSSLGMFSLILAGIFTVFSFSQKVSDIRVMLHPPFGIGLVAILAGIGVANLAAIRYIAAFKSTNIAIRRQIHCLRQALDATTFYLIEGVFPKRRKNNDESGEDLKFTDKVLLWFKHPFRYDREIRESTVKDAFNEKTSNYWKIFGNHRKLPIDNLGIRRHLHAYSESADKSAMFILFLLSEGLIVLPLLYFVHGVDRGWLPVVHPDEAYSTIALFFACLSAIFTAVGVWFLYDSYRRINKAVESCVTDRNSYNE